MNGVLCVCVSVHISPPSPQSVTLLCLIRPLSGRSRGTPGLWEVSQKHTPSDRWRWPTCGTERSLSSQSASSDRLWIWSCVHNKVAFYINGSYLKVKNYCFSQMTNNNTILHINGQFWAILGHSSPTSTDGIISIKIVTKSGVFFLNLSSMTG